MSMCSMRVISLAALVPFVFLAACGSTNDDSGINTGTSATVDFVNATGSNISVSNNGVVAAGNGNLVMGASSSCMDVNPSTNALAFTNGVTNDTISGFTPDFLAGSHYTVIAYTDASGNTRFTTINDAFTPTTGMAGVRVFNAASGSGNVVVLGNGTALGTGTGVAFANTGDSFSVPAGTEAVTWNTGTGTATIADAGNLSFTAGQNYVLVLTPAATGSTTLGSYLIPSC